MPFDILTSLLKDGKIDFSSQSFLFIPWNMWVMQQLNDRGLGNVMSPQYQVLHPPPAVDAIRLYHSQVAFHQLQSAPGLALGIPAPPLPYWVIVPQNDVYTAANRYQTDMQRNEAVFGQVLSIVLSNLTAVQVANVVHITVDPQENGRSKALSIILYYRNLFGSNSMANTNPIKDQMMRIPEATDAVSADYVISCLAFWNTCLAQMLPVSAAESDSALIARLFDKLKASMFDLVAQEINRSNPTFLVACSMVQSTITLARQRAPAVQRTLSASDSWNQLGHAESETTTSLSWQQLRGLSTTKA